MEFNRQLVKAKICPVVMTTDPKGVESYKADEKKAINVQFNPSELTISSSSNTKKRHAAGKNAKPGDEKAATGTNSTMSLTLFFDDITQEYGNRLPAALGLADKVKDTESSCMKIAALLKYGNKDHAPPYICFKWGKSFSFVGMATSVTITYTMFAPDGKPLRAKIALSIEGEEQKLMTLDKNQPFESPNRTKERLLPAGDSLWQLAQQEYNDPALWRPIAQANGILNPRKLRRATVLQVPSIK